jgi:hypothetical protein
VEDETVESGARGFRFVQMVGGGGGGSPSGIYPRLTGGQNIPVMNKRRRGLNLCGLGLRRV